MNPKPKFSPTRDGIMNLCISISERYADIFLKNNMHDIGHSVSRMSESDRKITISTSNLTGILHQLLKLKIENEELKKGNILSLYKNQLKNIKHSLIDVEELLNTFSELAERSIDEN